MMPSVTTKRLSLTIEIPGSVDATIAPGDTLDLGDNGVIQWLEGEEAEAYRRALAEKQRERRARGRFRYRD